MFDYNAILRMIAVIRPCIVLKGVYGTVPDCADRAPAEIAKIDDQVRWYAITFVINILRFKDGGADVDAVGICQSFKFSFQFFPQRFEFACFHDTLRLTPLDIEEDAGIIASIPPYLCLAPVNFAPVDRSQGGRLLPQCQVSLLNEPFIDADTT